MSPTLPFEIWAHIASYLPNIEVKTLFSVNRALYQISMNARYKTLRLQYPPQLTFSRLRMMWNTASVTQRVQELEISSQMLEVLWQRQQIKDHLRHLIGPFDKDPATFATNTKSATPTQKLLLDVVNNMHGLRSVSFDLRSTIYSEAYTAEDDFVMVGQVWSLLSHRIDSLSISVWEAHTPSLHPTLSSVLGVKHLSISLTGEQRSHAEGLADLINTASQSLESLRLETPFGYSFRRMFADLHTFPELKRAEFSFLKSFEASEIARFLNSHGESIEELKLAINCPPVTAGLVILSIAEVMPLFSIATLQLPSLRSLSIAWNFSRLSADITHQQLWADVNFPMLDTLKVISPAMDNEHLAFFCDEFKRSSGSRVRHLELPFTSTNAETFNHLSEAFPNLHTLILSRAPNPTMAVPPWDIDAFAAEMEHREYPNWALYDLEIPPPIVATSAELLWSSCRVMETEASRIPSVRSFRGSSHMHAPEDAKGMANASSVSLCHLV